MQLICSHSSSWVWINNLMYQSKSPMMHPLLFVSRGALNVQCVFVLMYHVWTTEQSPPDLHEQLTVVEMSSEQTSAYHWWCRSKNLEERKKKHCLPRLFCSVTGNYVILIGCSVWTSSSPLRPVLCILCLIDPYTHADTHTQGDNDCGWWSNSMTIRRPNVLLPCAVPVLNITTVLPNT